MSPPWPSRRDALSVLGSAAFAGCTTSLLGATSSVPPTVDGEIDDPVRVDDTWPQHRFDARNPANPDAEGPRTDPAWYWSYDVDSRDVRFATSLLLGTDHLVVPNYATPSLVTLDPTTGSAASPVELRRPVEFVPAIDGDELYVPAGSTMAAVDRAGDVRWTEELSVSVGPPTVTDSTVFVGSAAGTEAVYALDATSGELKWQVETGLVTTTPAVDDETVVVGDWDGVVRALATTDGTERWSRTVRDDWLASAPVVGDGVAFVCSGTVDYERGHVAAFDLEDGTRRWTRTFETGLSRSPALADGTLYVPDFNGTIHALDAANGRDVWTFSPLESPSSGRSAQHVDFSPAVGGETVYYAGPDDRVHAVDATTGVERWRTGDERDFDLAPILVGQYLFVCGARSIGAIGPG